MVVIGGGGEGGQSQEEVMDATAASIQERLPKPFPLDICEEKFPTLYEESMNTVVKQECLRYNKLLWEMAANLKDFRKAIKGHRYDCRSGRTRYVHVCQRAAKTMGGEGSFV